MKRIKSLSEKRLIVGVELNGKAANMLVDTGATVALVAEGARKKYGLKVGRRFPRPIVGAGGELTAYYCDTPALLEGRTITQFLLADIGPVVRSIRAETGIEIVGIISLPQMRWVGMQIDANDNMIILE